MFGFTWRFMGSYKGPFKGIYRGSIRVLGFRGLLGGSWVVIGRVISLLIGVIALPLLGGLRAPF